MKSLLEQIEFINPEAFLLLLLIPPLLYYYKVRIYPRQTRLTISSAHPFESFRSLRSLVYPFLPLLRLLAFIGLVLALSRPQSVLTQEVVSAEGIDIMLMMDISSSMLARDFDPDRLAVSKKVAKDFIDKRSFDRIGLVVFAGEAFTQCPLTTDHRILKDFLDDLECGLLEDGTAIGMGLASGVNRLKESEAKSKVIILLTDGVNNSGYIKPITAAEIAEEFRIKVYAIGVGTRGQALSPVSRRSDGRYIFGMANVQIDESLLEEIAEMTGGRYYRATDQQSLEEIYREIDDLEKTEIQVTVFNRYTEEFRKFLGLGMVFLFLELLLRNTLFRTIP